MITTIPTIDLISQFTPVTDTSYDIGKCTYCGSSTPDLYLFLNNINTPNLKYRICSCYTQGKSECAQKLIKYYQDNGYELHSSCLIYDSNLKPF